MTQAASPAVGPAPVDPQAQPDFAFAAPRERASPTPAPVAATADAPAARRFPTPALRFAAVALALLALLGAWHFWRQAREHEGAPAPAHSPLSADHDVKPPAAVASVPASPSAERIEATFAAVIDNRQALQSLNEGQKRQEEALNKMGHDVAELIDGLRQMQARQAIAPASAVSAKPHQTKATSSAPKTQAQLLSVDIWDGRPSVVVGTADPGDRRVIYLHEGDQHKGITLKRADHLSQHAVFDMGGRDVALSRERGQP